VSRRLVAITEIIAPYRIPVFNALARRGDVELHVIFLAETDPTQRQWHIYKDEINFSYQVLPSWRTRAGKQKLLLNWGVSSALKKAAPDAILCGGYNYPGSWSALSWARRNRVPFLLWGESNSRDFRSGNPMVEYLKRAFLRGCEGFVVPGKSSMRYFGQYKRPEQPIFTAPNSVDAELFAQAAVKVRKDAAAQRAVRNLPRRFFLFVGRLVPEKGVFDLLQAYNLLPPESRLKVGLVFVGDGVARAELLERSKAIHPGCVQFAGFAQREELPAYYGLADAFVFPTHTDPWGLVVNEAMACGLPVICSSSAGCAEDLVRDHWNGRVIPPGNVQQLASAMQELANDEELRAPMGTRSAEKIAEYSPQACAAGIATAVLSLAREQALAQGTHNSTHREATLAG
jgi:glycosyltransferase involved in cell wall biosynthesis